MPLTDAQITALREIGQHGGKVMTLKESMARINRETTALQRKKTKLQAELQNARNKLEELWEVLRS